MNVHLEQKTVTIRWQLVQTHRDRSSVDAKPVLMETGLIVQVRVTSGVISVSSQVL